MFYGAGKAFATVGAAGPESFSRDALGNLLATPGTADVVRGAAYGSFGTPDVLGDTPEFGYRGELHVGDHLHLRAREHDPALARFLTRDPIDGHAGETVVANPYHYATNDPVNSADPSGLSPSITDASLSSFGGSSYIYAGISAGMAAGVMRCDDLLFVAGTHGLRSSVSDKALACVAAHTAVGAVAGAVAQATSHAAETVANTIDDALDEDPDDVGRKKPSSEKPPRHPPIPKRKYENVLYRRGGNSVTNFTPRPHRELTKWPHNGISTHSSKTEACRGTEGRQQLQVLDRAAVERIPGLQVVEDPDPEEIDHFFVRPDTYDELVQWAASRGGWAHPWSEALRTTIIRQEKCP